MWLPGGREQLLCLGSVQGSRPGRERRFPGKLGEAGGSRRGGKGTSLCQLTAISPLRPPLGKADEPSKS